MNWIWIVIIAAAVVLMFLLKRGGQLTQERARQCRKDGALLIDVRSAAEFRSGHLRGAINIPLSEIEKVLPQRVRDRQQIVLLHCQSGARSGIASRKLKSIGYANAFNIGSYGRAVSIFRD